MTAHNIAMEEIKSKQPLTHLHQKRFSSRHIACVEEEPRSPSVAAPEEVVVVSNLRVESVNTVNLVL